MSWVMDRQELQEAILEDVAAIEVADFVQEEEVQEDGVEEGLFVE